MKKFFPIFILLCLCATYLNAQNKSNKGKEFWVAWGHNVLPAGTTTGATSKLSIYLSADAQANINISIPGTSFSTITDVINAGQVKTYQITLTSIMLTAEGKNINRAIHIESDTAIVAYAHQYGQNSSGATMLMPVETYGYTYYSLNYTQTSNLLGTGTSGTGCYSWCYVIASEDNTKIKVTPSVLTQGGIAANSTQTIILNKGEIYNFFGKNNGGSGPYNGNDLSGSKIVSVADDVNGICHPIAVFSGSSRILVNATNGGDMLQQQIFPASAWGTRYLTVPSSSSSSIVNFNNNVYRVAVRNASTIVKRNGVVLSGLQNNFYYEFQSNQPEFIEADGPILVAQFFPSSSASGFLGSLGDPEMIYLSPLEQAIKKADFYSTSKEAIGITYLSVITNTNGLSSLKVDGVNSFDYVAVHPQNSNYYIALKSLASDAQHTIECDSSFVATTYGLGSAESYGYNAGTLINNLNNIGGLQNSFGGGFGGTTCPNTPFRFSVQTAYKPSEMIWKLSQIANLQPVNVDTLVSNPIPLDSTIINGRKYYTYSLPREYTIPANGTYTLPIQCTAPEIDNCNNTETISTSISVVNGPKGNFTWVYSGCISDTAYLFATNTTPSYTITKYRWYFDDNTQDSVINPKKKFNTQGAHPTTLRLIASNGCIGDSIKIVTTASSPIATFGMSTTQACGSATVTFTDTSSFAGSSLNDYYWDFGNGTSFHTNAPTSYTQTYNAPGVYTIKHFAGVASGCKSDTAIKFLYIYAYPNVNFDYTLGCLQDSTVYFTDKTTISDAQALTWSWNFGHPASGTNNTSTAQNPSHIYNAYGTYPVTLTVTTVNGCVSTNAKPYTVSGFAAAINYTIANENNLCAQSPVSLTNLINITQDSVYKIEIYWDFANQPTVFTTYNNPVQNAVYTHQYPVFTTPTTLSYSIKWVVYSKGGCTSQKVKTITLNAKPDLVFNTLQGKCINAGISSIANANVTNGLLGTGTYYGNGTDAAGNFNAAIAGVNVHTIKYVFASTAGCADSIMQTIKVFPKPTAGFLFTNNICLSDSIKLTDTSKISSGTIKERYWDFGDNTTAIKFNAIPFYHTYSIYNSYTVKMYAVSDSACVSDTIPQLINIYPLPTIAFILPTGVCMPLGEAKFTNQSTIVNGSINSLSYVWNFGDNTTSPVINPTHYYTNSGPFTIQLKATSLKGCVDSLSKTLTAFYQQPIADFAVLGDTLCPNKPLIFSDSSIAPTGTNINYWLWKFGNGDTSNTQNPIYKYNVPGVYPIELVVKTPDGCTSNTMYDTVEIYKQPIVKAPTTLYTPEGIAIPIIATINDTSAFKYLWTPNIYLNNDTLLTPICTPIFTTTYKILAYGLGNCIAIDSVKVVAFKQLNIPNAFSPNADGIHDTWDIAFLNDYPLCKIDIFNRNGQLVYHSIGYSKAWNGKLNGSDLPVGTYYYIIELNNNGYSKLSGSVTIVR